MGIDAKIQTEQGECVATLGDPHMRMNRLLSFAFVDSTVCLRFIDPYGDTVFNRLQIPVLQDELQMLAVQLTEPNLVEVKRLYLKRAEGWPQRALDEAHKEMDTLSIEVLRQHLEQLLRLISDTLAKGHGHYVRFVGD
jgi:hypothetical protein